MISDLRRLRALREVAARGTVTAAAAALGYTPSAVSQQLAALEADVGAEVLERRGRNVVLTQVGATLVEHSHRVLSEIERAEAAVDELRGEPAGTLRIGALASATASILPLAIRTVTEAHPSLRCEVTVHPLDENARELRLGSIDLAVDQTYDLAPHDLLDGLHVVELLRESMLLLSPADDPVTDVSDAARRDWIASPASSACGRSTRAIVANAGIAPRYVYETEDHFATVRLVASGLAVAIVPSLAMLHPTDGVHVATVPGAHRRIVVATRPAALERPAVATMIEHLATAASAFEFEPGRS